MTREEAIETLRSRLVALAGGGSSMCRVAAERGIFCRGFRRWNDHDFHQRWSVVLGESNHLSRAQVEQIADLWQLAEQARYRVGLACDACTGRSGTVCRGWDEFSNEALATFCAELLGRRVRVESNEVDAIASDG